MNQQQPILPMQDEEEWWLEGRPLHSASGAVPGKHRDTPSLDSKHRDTPLLDSNNRDTSDADVCQTSYSLDYALNQSIAPKQFVEQSFYSCAPDLDNVALLGGNIAPNRFPAAPSVSSLTAAYVSHNGPWASLSPDFSHLGPSVSGLTAAYVSNNGSWTSLSPDFSVSGPSVSDLTPPSVPDGGPWTSLSPDFSNRHAPQATVDHSFCPTLNNYNSTGSPYAANSHTACSSGRMEGAAETLQPILDDGTNLTAPTANTGRQRVIKPRSVCRTCRKSFSRPSDLDRHVKKHQPGAKIHTCSVPGCDYEGSYRKDKLTAHMKNCHK